MTHSNDPTDEQSPLRPHRFVPTQAVIDLFRTAAPIDYDRFRQDLDTHARLVAPSRESGASTNDTARDAVEPLGRERFAQQVTAELAELRRDPEAWESYLAEAEATMTADGLD